MGGARWWPQHLAGLISGSLFPASPFPPCLQIAAPWGGFLVGGTRRGGGSVLPAHLNLARFLSNSCFSRWKSWMYFIWGQQGGREGLSARGRGTQTPTAPLPPMGAPQPWDRPYSSAIPPQSPASIPRAAPEGHQPWVRGHRGLFSAASDKPSPGGGLLGQPGSEPPCPWGWNVINPAWGSPWHRLVLQGQTDRQPAQLWEPGLGPVRTPYWSGWAEQAAGCTALPRLGAGPCWFYWESWRRRRARGASLPPARPPPRRTFFFSGSSLYFLERILVRSRLLISG